MPLLEKPIIVLGDFVIAYGSTLIVGSVAVAIEISVPFPALSAV